jgi:transcriptional regulator with XRE-family HTH domain
MKSTKMSPKRQATFGDRLGAIRRSLGLGAGKFAELLGCHRSYIYRLEQKEAENPSLEFIQTVATTFGVSADWLKTGVGEMGNPEAKSDRPAVARATTGATTATIPLWPVPPEKWPEPPRKAPHPSDESWRLKTGVLGIYRSAQSGKRVIEGLFDGLSDDDLQACLNHCVAQYRTEHPPALEAFYSRLNSAILLEFSCRKEEAQSPK